MIATSAAERLDQARKRARARKMAQVKAAREDPVAFIEYVMRNEHPLHYGERIICQPFHVEWQRHMEAHRNSVIEASIGLGKTTQVAGRILWRMGKHPERRVAICGAVADKVLKMVRQYIERSVELREVFPDLVPSDDPSDPWTDSQITVKRPGVGVRDPSLQVCDVEGNIIGSRVDDLYLDDILNLKNTLTEYYRAKIISWVDSTCQTRVTPTIGRVVMIGTPWHKDDALAVIPQRPGFAYVRTCVVENPDDAPNLWRTIWPDMWPVSELLEKKAAMLDSEFQRAILIRVRLDATARFKEAWILYCARGGAGLRILSMAPRIGQRPLPCFVGVDLAAGKKVTNAKSAICVGALLDDGRLRVVEATSGLWTGPEIVDRVRSAARRFGATVLVESNAVQVWIVQFAQEEPLDVGVVQEFYTGVNKWDPRFGVEALAVEFRQGLWQLPCARDSDFSDVKKVRWASDGVASLVSQALYFDPSQHTGDMLMAAWMMREGARRYAGPRTKHVNMLAR